MNFHPAQNWHKPWLTTEEATLFSMRERGFKYQYIAKQLGRSVPALKERVKRFGRRPTVAPPPIEEPARLSVFVQFEHLPDYYALGWQIISHDKFTVLLEWPHERDALFPRLAYAET